MSATPVQATVTFASMMDFIASRRRPVRVGRLHMVVDPEESTRAFVLEKMLLGMSVATGVIAYQCAGEYEHGARMNQKLMRTAVADMLLALLTFAVEIDMSARDIESRLENLDEFKGCMGPSVFMAYEYAYHGLALNTPEDKQAVAVAHRLSELRILAGKFSQFQQGLRVYPVRNSVREHQYADMTDVLLTAMLANVCSLASVLDITMEDIATLMQDRVPPNPPADPAQTLSAVAASNLPAIMTYVAGCRLPIDQNHPRTDSGVSRKRIEFATTCVMGCLQVFVDTFRNGRVQKAEDLHNSVAAILAYTLVLAIELGMKPIAFDEYAHMIATKEINKKTADICRPVIEGSVIRFNSIAEKILPVYENLIHNADAVNEGELCNGARELVEEMHRLGFELGMTMATFAALVPQIMSR